MDKVSANEVLWSGADCYIHNLLYSNLFLGFQVLDLLLYS